MADEVLANIARLREEITGFVTGVGTKRSVQRA